VVHTFHALGVVKRRHLGHADPSPSGRLGAEQMIAETVDRVVATCRDEVRELTALGADPRRVGVVPCGVDVDRFTPEGPAAARHRPRVVTVGRLVPRKGIDDVIRALAVVPDAELVVAGGPPADRLGRDREARRLRGLAATLDVADRVTLLGAVDRADMPALLRSATLVACTPWYEPFGIVPLEAMSSGVPVVATAVGGMLDTVVDGRTGVLVPPRDPSSLAQTFRALLDDPQRRARMGAAGRRRAERHYHWDAVSEATLDVYCSLVRRAPVPTAVHVGGRQAVGR
jgi:glycosyltransferase involved in cell wall biosynthesis